MAVALNAMGEKFEAVLDVTIVYPDGVPDFWHFLSGRVPRVVVRVKALPVPSELLGADYAGDAAVRHHFQQWVHQLWLAKDDMIDALMNQKPALTVPVERPAIKSPDQV
jgi:hypothetical protein